MAHEHGKINISFHFMDVSGLVLWVSYTLGFIGGG